MRIVTVGIGLALATALTLPAMAEVKSVKGEIVDQACYMKDKANKGDAHKDCGESCVRRGGPVALVTADGEVYQITGSYTENKNAKLVEHVSHTVEVTGEVAEKDGKKTIAVSELKMAS